MIERGNADRFELSTFYSTIDALTTELHISIYTVYYIVLFKTHTTFTSNVSLLWKIKIFYKSENSTLLINFHKLIVIMNDFQNINNQLCSSDKLT